MSVSSSLCTGQITSCSIDQMEHSRTYSNTLLGMVTCQVSRKNFLLKQPHSYAHETNRLWPRCVEQDATYNKIPGTVLLVGKTREQKCSLASARRDTSQLKSKSKPLYLLFTGGIRKVRCNSALPKFRKFKV